MGVPIVTARSIASPASKQRALPEDVRDDLHSGGQTVHNTITLDSPGRPRNATDRSELYASCSAKTSELSWSWSTTNCVRQETGVTMMG